MVTNRFLHRGEWADRREARGGDSRKKREKREDLRESAWREDAGGRPVDSAESKDPRAGIRPSISWTTRRPLAQPFAGIGQEQQQAFEEDSIAIPTRTPENSGLARGINSRRLDSKNHVLERHPAGRGRHVRDNLPERLEDVQERHHLVPLFDSAKFWRRERGYRTEAGRPARRRRAYVTLLLGIIE